MSTRFAGAAALAACAIVLTACSESGTPVPGGGPDTTTKTGNPPTTTTAAQDNRHGAPAIDNPLDATKQIADPCSSLSSAQLSELGLKGPGKDDKDESAPSCSWYDSGGDLVNFAVSYIVSNTNGIVDLYRGEEEDKWAYWEPTTVNGYPGVWHFTTDQRKRGYCTFSAGVNDELHFTVNIRGGDPDTACEQAKTMGAAVIDTLKSGG